MQIRVDTLSQINSTSFQLEKIKNSNIYNDVFKISHDGPFGTINGLRLGKLPSIPVNNIVLY